MRWKSFVFDRVSETLLRMEVLEQRHPENSASRRRRRKRRPGRPRYREWEGLDRGWW